MRCVITVCLLKKFKIHKRSCNCFCLLQSQYQQSVVENQSHQMNHQLLSQGKFDYRGKRNKTSNEFSPGNPPKSTKS